MRACARNHRPSPDSAEAKDARKSVNPAAVRTEAARLELFQSCFCPARKPAATGQTEICRFHRLSFPPRSPKLILCAPRSSKNPAALWFKNSCPCPNRTRSNCYSSSWPAESAGPRLVRSVANLTRRDGRDFLELAPQVPVRTTVQVHPLEEGTGPSPT